MSEYKPIDECKTVAELLADPARWTKGDSARDHRGHGVASIHPDACCFCVLGAMSRIYEIGTRAYNDAKHRLGLVASFGFASWNDAPERTHAEVLEAVRRAGI